MTALQPNTTQVPNFIIDELMAQLSDTALRVLLVVVRQTLGWEEDSTTKRRKSADWISRNQLIAKTGRQKTAISTAITELVTLEIIETLDKSGHLLPTAADRKRQNIYYRLKTSSPESGHGTSCLSSPESGHEASPESGLYKRNYITKEQKILPATSKPRSGKQLVFDRIITHCASAQGFEQGFANYGKQTKAIKAMLDASYAEDDITFVIDEMAAEQWWQEHPFDLKNVQDQMHKYMHRTVTYAKPKFGGSHV